MDKGQSFPLTSPGLTPHLGPKPKGRLANGWMGWWPAEPRSHREGRNSPALMYFYMTLHALYCTELYSIALHCTVHHCTALHYTTLQCTALYNIALHCTVQHCTAQHYVTPRCNALRCTSLHNTALYCTVLYSSALLFFDLGTHAWLRLMCL